MTLPLDGIRILDLTQVMLGPCATQLLGDFGADVIKIEQPGQGDLSRGSVPDPAGLDNPVFVSLNRNKRSKRIPAAEAYRVGLVNEVVPRTELDAAVDRWLEETTRVRTVVASCHQAIGKTHRDAFRRGGASDASPRRRESARIRGQ